MLVTSISAMLLAVAAPVPEPRAAAVPTPPMTIMQLAQMTIRQRIVIRVPRVPDPREDAITTAMRPPKWIERKGPKCVPLPMIAGASLTQSQSIDLVTVDGGVLRAKFDDECPALDFYKGFYLRQTSDGQICADRDSLRSRSGGVCRIKSFRQLIRKR